MYDMAGMTYSAPPVTGSTPNTSRAAASALDISRWNEEPESGGARGVGAAAAAAAGKFVDVLNSEAGGGAVDTPQKREVGAAGGATSGSSVIAKDP